jgi:hypothetical protein
VRTASAELGYWRWKFLRDAVGLDRLPPVAHTTFNVSVVTAAVDLRVPPFDTDASVWTDPADYTRTQAFARIAREAALGGLVYGSVRSPEPSWCMALLTPAAFTTPRPNPARETWYLAVTANEVSWRSDRGSMRFSTVPWAAG